MRAAVSLSIKRPPLLWRAAFVLACAIAATSLAPRTARADLSDAERRAAARSLFAEGVTLQDQGKAAEALTRFERAQKLFDAPTHLLHIAECQALTGQLVEAAETYRVLVHTPLPEGASEAFVQAKQRGAAELPPLQARIPKLQVQVVRPPPRDGAPPSEHDAKVVVRVNDDELPPELVAVARPVNPGKYVATATAEGRGEVKSDVVVVAERESRTITLTLHSSDAPAAVAVAPPPPEYRTSAVRPGSIQTSTSTGILVGGHANILAPSGNVDGAVAMSDVASPGGSLGLDLALRFARVLYVGGTVDLGALGSPERAPPGATITTQADATTTTAYGGGVLGFVSSIDKVGVLGEVGVGYRGLSRKFTIQDETLDLSYGGAEFALAGGVMIPAGRARIVPKLTFNLGSFSRRTISCSDGAAAVAGPTACSGGGSIGETAQHGMVGLGLTMFYSADIGKPAAAR